MTVRHLVLLACTERDKIYPFMLDDLGKKERK